MLVPLVQRDEVTVLLTQRTDHLTDHPGQISFPGGRAEPDDADAVGHRAARGATKRSASMRAHVEVLGALPTYTTGTGFIVTPVVALVRARLHAARSTRSRWPRCSRCRWRS